MNQQSATPSPDFQRVRHELKQRSLTVKAIEYATPKMLRITLTGDDLADFTSLAPDDHIKIFPGSSGDIDRSKMRNYTPRYFDPDTQSLVIDFAIHDAGPATAWALEAKVGDTLLIGGPKGSLVISGVKRWLLIGDETALPAIGRRIEEADATNTITSIITVVAAEEEQNFITQANLDTHWLHRPAAQATDAAEIIAKLEAIAIEPETFVWVATEASVARKVRAYLIDTRNHPSGWMRVSGYWVLGKSDVHESIES